MRSFAVIGDSGSAGPAWVRGGEYGPMCDELRKMRGEQVVLDTDSPIVYLGTLAEVTERTFVLTSADMHDCRDGHANKEEYLADARDGSIAVNRRKVVVMRSAVISVSRLADIVVQ